MGLKECDVSKKDKLKPRKQTINASPVKRKRNARERKKYSTPLHRGQTSSPHTSVISTTSNNSTSKPKNVHCRVSSTKKKIKKLKIKTSNKNMKNEEKIKEIYTPSSSRIKSTPSSSRMKSTPSSSRIKSTPSSSRIKSTPLSSTTKPKKKNNKKLIIKKSKS